jgi:hypothetical protein
LFLIHGEPGIGKTRLADELAARVKARGVQVLWGRCWEGDGAPAYWPWIQVIRSFLGALDPQRRTNLAVESEIGADIIRNVSQIIPDLRSAQLLPSPSTTEKLDPGEARFRLFDSVTNFLKIGARSHPTLIVIDDLHDAHEASLALLRFMARDLKGAAISIVASYRDTEVRRSPGLSKVIGELSREARSIPVSGLNEAEVTKLVEFRAERTPDETLVAKLWAATNGNPLFVDGIVRNLIAEGAFESAGALKRAFKIPSGVREAIRGRLDSLSRESNSILAAAAAIGNEFEFNLCQSVADVSTDEAYRPLDEVTRAGVVTALGHGRYQFSHALIREVVYEELDTKSRILIHGKIAKMLEETYQKNIDPHLAELAHHFREAGMTEKAIDYSLRAGHAAAAVLAYTDAMVHLQAALELMERQGADALRRADLQARLGHIAFQVDRAASLKYGESAIALYESLGRFDQAARVHILLGNIFHMRDDPLFNETLASDHLRRAESVMGKESESVSLVDLYHIIAANECHKMNVVGTAAAARRGIEVSDRLGRRAFWQGPAAFYAWSLVISGKLREGFALFGEAVQAAVESNVLAQAATWGAAFLSLWLGDPRGARAWLERELSKVSRRGTPYSYQYLSYMIAQTYNGEGQLLELQRRAGNDDPGVRFWIGGELEAVAASIENQIELGEKTGNRANGLDLSVPGGLAYGFFLGEYLRAEALFKYGLDNEDRGLVVVQEMRARPWLARLYVLMNRLDEAAEQVARCRQIMAAGEDWRGLVGDVASAEAAVEAARGNYEDAYRLLETALAVHRKYHTAWHESYTLELWGRALGAAGDPAGAAEKFDAAIENHRSRGVGRRYLEWLTAEKARALGPRPTRTEIGEAKQSQSADSTATGTFRKEGEFWTISYLADTFRLKDAKGLHYLAYLLGRPGQRIHVYDLTEVVEGGAPNPRTIHSASEDLQIVSYVSGPGPTIDARARAEYRASLRDLQADLNEAERMNDLGRCERVRAEIEMVGQELAGSLGLGGRARAVSASADRARGLVGKNIRSTVEKIRHQDPGLARYFAVTISTGNFCAYQPDHDHPISWQL